jgi:hypothetical protein
MTAAADADRPAVAEVNAGDLILVADDKLALVALVRSVTISGRGRTLHLEVPWLPQCTFAVPYEDTEVVERHACTGQAA